MAKNENTADTNTNTGSNGATDKPKLSTAATKKLFTAADDADKAYKDALTAADELKADVVTAVRAIYEGVGQGPFEFKGRQFAVAKKQDLYFFKSLGKSTIQKIA